MNVNELEARIKALLPGEYQERYEEVQPVSMGSAGLKFSEDGRVAWDEIWGSFCDLAMAGGPPHKGSLLGPGDVRGERYAEVVAEICRGIGMVTGLAAEAARPGWVRVECFDVAMAGWLVRAITMENVAVRVDGKLIELPAGAEYRIEKEIKNVVTVIAKTCHYWRNHMWPKQQREIGELLAHMNAERPLVQPGSWRAEECGDVRTAIRRMRETAARNFLARREGTVLLVAVPDAGVC